MKRTSRLTNTIAAMMTKSRQRQRQSSLPRQSLSQKEKTHQRQKLPKQLPSRRANRRRSWQWSHARQSVDSQKAGTGGQSQSSCLCRTTQENKNHGSSNVQALREKPTRSLLSSQALQTLLHRARAHSTTEGWTLQLLAVPAKVVEKGFLKGSPCNH